jgi:hypothetical protein
LSFQFTLFDLEDDYDTLMVRDGPTLEDKILAVYTGSTIPAPITSTTNFLLVTFFSDRSVEKTGFKAKWEPGILILLKKHADQLFKSFKTANKGCI